MSELVPRHIRFGGWIMLPEPLSIEAMGRAGFDFVVIDLQHGGFDLGSAFRALQQLDLMGVSPLVRLSADELAAVPRLCDHGAAGVIVAMVQEPEVARQALLASRYQPEGQRSYVKPRYGLRPEPAHFGALHPLVYVMIESLRGFQRAEEIVRVPGLDGVHIGPADLALGLGFPFASSDPAWRSALHRVRDVAHAAGLPVGMHAASGIEAMALGTDGFDEVVVASDITLLRGALARELTAAHGDESATEAPAAVGLL